MKRIFAFVLCLCIAVCTLAGCGHKNDSDGETTTSSSILTNTSTTAINVGSTTSNPDATTTAATTNVTTTTVQVSQTTTNTSNTTATTTVPVTTTTQNTDLPDEVVFYSQYPNVPDYGAFVGVEYSKFKNGTFYYDAALVAQVDPENKTASRYMQLLQQCGYVALSPYDKNGVQGFVYSSSDYGVTVLFGASRENGAIVVAISQ